MTQVSTNLTLLLKIFLPTFWLVFFGAFTAAIWVTSYEYYGQIPGPALRLGATLFYAGGALFFYLTVIRLKRVEMDEESIYVTNYFKHFRYPFSNVRQIREQDFFLFRLITIEWIKPGYFGKKIVFIPSNARLKKFLEQHPELTSELMKLERKKGAE